MENVSYPLTRVVTMEDEVYWLEGHEYEDEEYEQMFGAISSVQKLWAVDGSRIPDPAEDSDQLKLF